MNRKTLTLALTLLLAASLTACSGGGGGADSPTAPTAAPVLNVHGTWQGYYGGRIVTLTMSQAANSRNISGSVDSRYYLTGSTGLTGTTNYRGRDNGTVDWEATLSCGSWSGHLEMNGSRTRIYGNALYRECGSTVVKTGMMDLVKVSESASTTSGGSADTVGKFEDADSFFE